MIDRYTNIIRGIFSGHTHEDSFQLIRSKLDDEISGVIHVVPALSNYPKVNPSFRIYEMDAKTFTLLDYVQYRLYLDEANRSGIAEWKIAYRFTQLYRVPNLQYSQYITVLNKINHDQELFKTFMNMLWAEGPRGPALLTNYDKALNFANCRMWCSDLYEFNECTGSNYINLEYMLGYGILSKFLDPAWEYAYYQ